MEQPMEQFFSLVDLWDLRGELDSAVSKGDFGRILEVKTKFEEMVNGVQDYSGAFLCYGYGFRRPADKDFHCMSNINAIIRNIWAYEKRYIDGEENVSLKLKPANSGTCHATEVWTLRAMYDKFLDFDVSGADELETQQNMILGKAVVDRLKALKEKGRVNVWDEVWGGNYYSHLDYILTEVSESYLARYKSRKPRLHYEELSDEFMEK